MLILSGWQEARDTWWRKESTVESVGGSLATVQSTTDAFSEENSIHPDKPSITNPFTFRDPLKDDFRHRRKDDTEDSMCIRFEDSPMTEEASKGWPDVTVDEESTGGIVFKENTTSNQVVPTQSEVTKSKFWADGSTTSSTTRYLPRLNSN